MKKNSFPLSLIVLGLLIFYWTRDFKQVPSGIGPAFFPRIVAILLIGLSIICILMPDHKASEEIKTGKDAAKNIAITVVSLILMVGVMKYIHPVIGISLFLALYLKVIAKTGLKNTAIITVAGTAILYIVIRILRIPM